MKYRIAGKVFQFINEQNDQLTPILKQLLSGYQEAKDEKEDLRIIFSDTQLSGNVKYSNPKIHGELDNGFLISNFYGKVAYKKVGNTPEVVMQLNQRFFKNSLLSRFITNGEFSTLLDKLSSVLYETLIVPSLFFFDDLAIVHSTGVSTPDKKGILLGGTGGIGKTSMEIELCFYDNYRFVNDDIGVVNEKGILFPNFAYPKIYGYNLEGYAELKREIFKNRSFFDKLSWKYKKARNGISGVRRKIEPEAFKAITEQSVPLQKYYLLSRHNSKDFKLSEFNPSEAAIETQLIIESEYAEFFKHLKWHAYNSRMIGKNPIIDIYNLQEKKIEILEQAFSKARLYKVLIPEIISHKDYLSQMKKLIIDTPDA